MSGLVRIAIVVAVVVACAQLLARAEEEPAADSAAMLVAVQVPPPTVTAPVGTEYVLQYVLDYNGEVPDLFEVRKDGVVVGSDLSYTIPNPVQTDSGFYEISCRNSAGTTAVSTQITFE